MNDKILDSVNKYYTEKIIEHGVSPKGVDWNGQESQELRFQQLTSVIKEKNQFSVLDFGCGYGALLDYLMANKSEFHYRGFDISEEMINHAKKHNEKHTDATWATKMNENDEYDYSLLSGIFNVKQQISDNDWQKYVTDTLHMVSRCSKKGFSFNILTSYSDKEYMRDYLYYADPCFYFDYCKKHFSKYVALLHDYPLYEFTIVVTK